MIDRHNEIMKVVNKLNRNAEDLKLDNIRITQDIDELRMMLQKVLKHQRMQNARPIQKQKQTQESTSTA